MKKLALSIVLITVFLLSACRLGKPKISYQPPLLPLIVEIDSQGEISASLGGSLQTPIGTFSVESEINPDEKFPTAQGTLTVRVNGKETFYDLKGNNVNVTLDSGYYKAIMLQQNGNSWYLEATKLDNIIIADSTATPTYISTKPQLIQSGINYRIEQICNGQTSASLQIQAPSFPYNKLSDDWWIYPVVKDIAGNWQLEHPGFGSQYYFKFSSQGVAEEEIPSGNWMVKPDIAVYNAHLYGRWGNTIIGDEIGFVFPVRSGCTTKSTLLGGKLEIGILDSTGTNARIDTLVTVFCQTTDIAGKKISDISCPGGQYGVRENSEPAGVATFYLGPGTYYIVVTGPFNGANYNPKNYYDISISVGEEKRVTINYP